MNVFLREIRAYRSSTLVWIASFAGLVVVFLVGLYPAFTTDVATTKDLISSLPAAVRAALSISLSTFFTIYGFFAYLLNFTLVAAAVQAMNLGTGVISKEITGKTADFLLSKPLTRPKVISSKLAAAFSMIVVTSAAFTLVSYLAALVAAGSEPVKAGTFLLIALSFFLIQVFFVALGALFAVLLPKVKSVIAITLPTVFAFFIIGTLGDVLGQEAVRYISPFKYVDPMYVITKTSIEVEYLLVEAVIVIVAIVATYVIYLRKDIPSAT